MKGRYSVSSGEVVAQRILQVLHDHARWVERFDPLPGDPGRFTFEDVFGHRYRVTVEHPPERE
jgi:hypothetical protein